MSEQVDAKKPRLSASLQTLRDFQLKEVLDDRPFVKSIFIHAEVENPADYEKSETAIVILEKQPFSRDSVGEILSNTTKLSHSFTNDIYSSYDAVVDIPERLRATLIYPATDRHIQKFQKQETRLIPETAEMYQTITKPHIDSSALSSQWVKNILDGNAEQDRVLHRHVPEVSNNGFILIPDIRWDMNDGSKEGLHCLALVTRHDLRSIRDLTEEHLPLLTEIRNIGSKVIEEKFGVGINQMRIFLHYHPTFYHLHIHFVHFSVITAACLTERAHLIDDIIENIKLMPNYYQKRTFIVSVKECDPLFELLNK